jgi:hypothetical protein
VDDVNLHIDELVIDHPVAAPAQHAFDALRHPVVDRLGVPVIAEIRRAVSAALDAGSEG